MLARPPSPLDCPRAVRIASLVRALESDSFSLVQLDNRRPNGRQIEARGRASELRPRVGASLWRLLVSIAVLWLGFAGALPAAAEHLDQASGECAAAQPSCMRSEFAPWLATRGAEQRDDQTHQLAAPNGVAEVGGAAQGFEVEVEIDADAPSNTAFGGARSSATIRARRVRVLLRSDSHARRRSREPPLSK